MFKKLIRNILESETFDEAFNPVDLAFQHEKISWNDHQLLLKLCEKCFQNK